MKQYGFECEYWVMPLGGEETAPILVPQSIPSDECGYLAEVRAEPHKDPLTAAYLMLAEEDRLQYKARNFTVGQCILVKNGATRQLSDEFKRQALRQRGKQEYPQGRGNIYGKDYSPKDKLSRAGLHVHFSNSEEVRWTSEGVACKECGHRHKSEFSRTVPQQQDIAKIVRTLDEAFKEQIKAAKRIPGFYELKPHGFEYRSLPADVNPVLVARVIEKEGL